MLVLFSILMRLGNACWLSSFTGPTHTKVLPVRASSKQTLISHASIRTARLRRVLPSNLDLYRSADWSGRAFSCKLEARGLQESTRHQRRTSTPPAHSNPSRSHSLPLHLCSTLLCIRAPSSDAAAIPLRPPPRYCRTSATSTQPPTRLVLWCRALSICPQAGTSVPCQRCPWRPPPPAGVRTNAIDLIFELHDIF